jgi:transaldolase
LACFAALAESRKLRRSAAKAALGQHRDQGPRAADNLYIQALAAPDTINTIPEKTLLALAGHGAVDRHLPADGGDGERVIASFGKAGVDADKLAADLKTEGAASFVASWKDLLSCIQSDRAQDRRIEAGCR